MVTVRFAEDFVARIHEDLTWTIEEGGDAERLAFLNEEYGENHPTESIGYFPTHAHRIADAAARDLRGIILEFDESEDDVPEDRIY